METLRLTDARRLAAASDADLGLLRDVLERAGYTAENAAARLSLTGLPISRLRLLPGFRAAQPADPLDALIRLFLLGIPVNRRAAAEALHPLPLRSLETIGLAESRDQDAVPLVRLYPVSGLILAHDPHEILPGAAAPGDFVPGCTDCTNTLLEFTVRGPARSFLDLGTGNGVHAIAAARHSARVWATDRSGRALQFACFNARLNGVTNVEFRRGDRFEPVRGLRFDRIVSNPPFLIAPGRRYTYRDSGMRGDDFCRSLVRQAPDWLEENGLATFIAEWIHPKGGDPQRRLCEWFAGIGCDALVLRLDTRSPSSYADGWIRDTESAAPERWGPLYEQYLAYYEELGAEAISSGVIILRKRSAVPRHRLRFDEVLSQRLTPVGDWVLFAFELGDALEKLDDEALLAERLRLNPGTRLEQEAVCTDNCWRPARAGLHLVSGLEFRAPADPRIVGLLARSGGKTPLGALLAGMAEALHTDAGRLAQTLLPVVRGLVERGFLVPESVALPGENRR